MLEVHDFIGHNLLEQVGFKGCGFQQPGGKAGNGFMFPFSGEAAGQMTKSVKSISQM